METPKPVKRSLSVVVTRRQPGRAAKRPRADPVTESHLPVEIWEHIFRYIPDPQLLRLRLICHRWSELISGSPSLMNRFDVVVESKRGNRKLDKRYVPDSLPPVVVKMQLRQLTLVTVDHWWPKCGEGLRELQLLFCNVSVGVLFGMLRQAPNLKRLILYCVHLTGRGEAKFRMDRMEMFGMFYVRFEDNARNILDGLGDLFPRLEELVVESMANPGGTKVLQSIRTMQNTLRYLTLSRWSTESNVLAKLCEMKELRLKSVDFDLNFPDDLEKWTQFCRMQPLLETLTIKADCEILAATGRLLPKLKALTASVEGTMVASFLGTMPGLEFLEIIGDYTMLLRFAGHSSPNLEQFVLRYVETVDLFQFMQRSPKLRRMHLDDCNLGVRELLTAPLPNLTVLVLDSIDCDPFILLSLFSHSSRLEELQLCQFKYVDDACLRDFCKQLKNLKKLHLSAMRCMTDDAAKHILRHCRALEELDADFSDAMLDRIENTGRVRVKRRVVPNEDDHEEEIDG